MEHSSTLYRVHPLMLMYPAPIGGARKYIIELSSFDPPLIIKDWRFGWAIALLPETFTSEEALDLWARDSRTAELKDEIWKIATQSEVIIRRDESRPELQRFNAWQSYGWSEASVYQEATRDYPFVKMDEPGAFTVDEARMARYLNDSDVPSIYLSLPFEFSIPLRKIKDEESANELLRLMSPDQRRGLDGLSLLFDVCFGERTKIEFNIQGSFLRKSIPSGGARHPTEIFFATFSGCCISPGIYHYSVESHSLNCIERGDFYKEFEIATFDLFKKFKKRPVGLLTFTSLYERAMWRYRDARSWRAVLIDVGHALMIFRTVLSVLGYKSYTYQKVRDKELCRLLKISPLRQTPQYVGTLV
jgi:SagB-type dehydrogenase family enzyme